MSKQGTHSKITQDNGSPVHVTYYLTSGANLSRSFRNKEETKDKRNRLESCACIGRGTTASSVFCLTAPLSRIMTASRSNDIRSQNKPLYDQHTHRARCKMQGCRIAGVAAGLTILRTRRGNQLLPSETERKLFFLTTRIENNQLRQHKHGLEQFRQGISGSSKLRIYPFKVRQTVRFYVDTVICRRTKASARRRALYARQGDPNVTVQGRHTQSITRVGAS